MTCYFGSSSALTPAVLAGLVVPSAEAAFPGVNGKIAFTGSGNGYSEIYVMNQTARDRFA